MRTIVTVPFLAAMLTACGTHVVTPMPLAASEVEGPAPGKWRYTTTVNGQSMPPYEVCIKTKTTFKEPQFKSEGETCTENAFSRQGNMIIAHSVCHTDEEKITTDSVVTGDMNSSYVIETVTTVAPPPWPAPAKTNTKAIVERIGDC